MPPTPANTHLARLARAQLATIDDLELADVWGVICSEIEAEHVGAEGWFSVASLIDVLSSGSGRGVDEFSITVDDEGGPPDRVLVDSGFILPNRLSCGREALLLELRRLLRAFRATWPER